MLHEPYGEFVMKVIATFDLDKRHAQDSDLLEAYVRDAVTYFNTRVNAEANLQTFRLCTDEHFDHCQRLALAERFLRLVPRT
jgi:hypothetical protein